MKAGDKVVIFATVGIPGDEYSSVKFGSGNIVVLPTSDLLLESDGPLGPQLDRIEATLASILKAVTPTQLPPGEIAGMHTEGPGASAPPQFSDDPAVAALQREWQAKAKEYQVAYDELAQSKLPALAPERVEMENRVESLRLEVADLVGKIEKAQKR